MSRRGRQAGPSQTPAVSPLHRGSVASGASGLDPPESAGWCVPAAELQGLIELLVSPAVMLIIQRLAVAPCQHLELCLGAGRGNGGTFVVEAALCRLQATDLIDSDCADIGLSHAWWSLTVGGRELLEPLTALATWYAENRHQIVGTTRELRSL